MNCELCELSKQSSPIGGNRFSSLDTNKPISIMVIGDFPHDEEAKNGRAFTGKLGIQLANLLKNANIPIESVYVTTLVKCRPVAPNHLDGRIKKSNITACSMYLMEEIANVNPKLLLLLGESVFHYFFPELNFSDYRGKIVKHELTGINTVTTYHPLAMLSSTKFDQLIATDFNKASEEVFGSANVKHVSQKDYKFVTWDRKDPIAFLKKIVERVKTVDAFSFDIETHGEGYFSYKLLSIGISWKENTGISIPIWVRDDVKYNALKAVADFEPQEHYRIEQTLLKSGKMREKRVKIKGLVAEDFIEMSNLLPDEYAYVLNHDTKAEIRNEIHAILDKEPPMKKYWGSKHDEVLDLLRELMATDTPKIAHNGGYDVNRLRGIGIDVKNYAYDTILMHHLLDEERPHGLDDLSYVYTKDGGYKSEKNIYLASSKTSWANIPTNVLLPYNAQDADVTLQLFNTFKTEIQKTPKRWDLLMNLVMPAQRMLVDMSFRGSSIDMDWVNKTLSEYRNKMNDMKIEIQQLVAKVVPNVYVVDSPEEEKEDRNRLKSLAAEENREPIFPTYLNINSTQQLVDLFINYYHAPLTKQTKSGVALDSDVLNKLKKKFPVAAVLLEYKALKKLESTYLIGLVDRVDTDGKIHTEYKCYGTVTSRLASSNPNLQNVPLEMKPMFVPPKGYLCVNVDQSAAELHVLGWMANDRKMMKIFEDHRDLHRETAAQVFSKKIEDVTDSERKIAKRCFSSDTFILTEDGYIRGKDIGNRKVYTLDGKLQNQHHVFEERDGLKITLRNGMKLRVTADHKFLDFSHVVPTWKKANEFKVGDVIGTLKSTVPLKPVYFDNEYNLRTHSSRFPQKIELDADLAYLMGLYLGDGSMLFDTLGEAAQVQLVIKRGSRTHILQTLKDKYPISIAREFATYSSVRITSKEIAQLFYKHLGYTKTKHIPDAIFKCDKSIVDNFISGLIDSDGSTSRGIVRFRNTNETMVRGLCQLATLNGYAVTYGTEKYDTTIKMSKDPNKRYTGIMHVCTFVSKPNLNLYVENKKEGLQRKKDTNEINRWFINKKECKEAVANRGHDIAWGNYRDGNTKGLTDAVVTKWGFVHKNYWAQEIVWIEQDRFETLIMETDTHFFVGNAVRSSNCSFGTAYSISGKGLADLLEPEGVKISEAQGNKFIKKWRETYPNCAHFLDKAARDFVRYGFLETPFGRRRHKFKKFMSEEREAAYSRMACNFPIQSTASDIQLSEMVHMYPTLLENGVLPVFTVHDSIVMYCPIEKLEWLRDYYKQETCRRFPEINNLLMYTEMEVGRNYGEHVKLPYDCDFNTWKKEHEDLFS